MALTREERKLLHQKSKQPTFGSGKPDNKEGNEGDISFRQVEGSGTVEYVKTNGDWVAVASSGKMPAVRIVGGSGSSSTITGVTSHGDLSGLTDDDHTQYLLIDGSRAMTSVVTIGADSDGTDRSITWGHSTLKTIMGIDDSADAFVINTDDAFDATLANNSFSIDASHNVIMAGDVSVGDDLLFTSSGAVINWNSGDITLTHAAGKLTFGGDGAVELDFNNHEMTNVDINSGAIDGATIGASSQAAGDFTAIGAVSAGTIVGTTIDATTDFTIGGTVITDATITDDGNFKIDADGDITLDANGADISFKDNNTNPLIFTNSSGSWFINSSTAASTLSLGARSATIIKMKEDGTIYINGYDANYGTIQIRDGVTVASNYADYKINILADKHMFTMGEADFKQNYSMISQEHESAAGTFHASYGT